MSAASEYRLLGLAINDEAVFRLCLDKGITLDSFTVKFHSDVFSTMVELDKKGTKIEPVVLADQCIKRKIASNPADIINISIAAPVTINAEFLIDEVVEGFRLNKLKAGVSDTVRALQSNLAKPDEVIANINKFLLEVNLTSKGGLKSIGSLIDGYLERLEHRLVNGDTDFISSGWQSLDEILQFRPTDFIVIGGRPAMGKTAFMLNLTLAAMHFKKKVAIFSLEMSEDQIIERKLGMISKLSTTQLRKGELSEPEQDRLMFGVRKIHEYRERAFVDETPSITLSKIRARCLNLIKAEGLDAIYIDYLQLMKGEGKEPSRERELSIISAGLKEIAKELRVPVIALAQLNRGTENRPDKRPKMSDIRESGGIEQDADVIMFLHRHGYYYPDEDDGSTEIIIKKNRHGALETVKLFFQPITQRFLENK